MRNWRRKTNLVFKYSVIIPVYNAEKTLNRCVDSLVNQQFEEAEIILVNDGSIDNSGEICEQYSHKYCQIKYIAQSNGGVSRARNTGLDVATGTYVMFVDSDDYVADNYFHTIDSAVEKKECDLLQFSHFELNDGIVKKVIYHSFFSDNYDQILEKISDLICRKIINGPCTKVYKREIIEKYKIEFTVDTSIAEDRAFNIKYALHVKSLNIIESPIYYVSLENPNSLSRGKQKNLDEQLKRSSDDIFKSISDSELSESSRRIFIDAINFGRCRVIYKKAKDMHRENVAWSIRIQEIKRFCKDINKCHLSYPRTRYCRMISLPIRWELAWIIDVMAWKLTH